MVTGGQGRKVVAAFGRPPAAGRQRLSRAQRLARDAAEAAELRAYQADPDVIALRVERVRAQVDRLCWAGIVLGLAFTMANVQHFAAGGSPRWSLPWLVAWLLDPMVSLVLLAILRAEQLTARYQVQTGPWVRRAKWLTLTATYVMNTWTAYAALSASTIVLHSVPPLVVLAAAEAIIDLRDKLTQAATVAFTTAAPPITARPATTAPPRVHGAPRRRTSRRRTFDEYLAQARTAWTPDVQVKCSRGLSPRLAAALIAKLADRRSEP